MKDDQDEDITGGGDEFDQMLEDAIERPDDDDDEPISGGDIDDEPAPRETEPRSASRGGGDIDDEPEPLPSEQNAAQQDWLRQSAQNLEGWARWEQQQQQAYASAQAELERAETAYIEDIESDQARKAKHAALSALMDARSNLDDARRGYAKAQEDHAAMEYQMPRPSQAEQDWLATNEKYKTDRRYARSVRSTAAQLRREGMDQSSPRFWEQVEQRMRTPTRMNAGRGRRAPAAPAVHTDRRTDDGDGRKMLKHEEKFIRQLGYDPNNKAVREQWSVSKSNTRRIAKARGFM
jgi:hypothetical protein